MKLAWRACRRSADRTPRSSCPETRRLSNVCGARSAEKKAAGRSERGHPDQPRQSDRALNADLFEKDTGWWVTNEQEKVHYADWDKAHTTLDGLVRETPMSEPFAVVEFKFMFPFGFDLQKAIEKYYRSASTT